MDVSLTVLLIVGLLVGIPVAGWFIWLRSREQQHESWPITTATIETGNVEIPKHESALIALLLGHPISSPPIVLMLGYSFTVNGSFYSGKTAIRASDYGDAEWIMPKLRGMHLNIRYDPKKPNSSHPLDLGLGGFSLLRENPYSGGWS